ncbi:hypothetical protein H257_17997 [Aphanomyces astaci]|uniref:Guanylate cyclase domain-containing protein n=1 Tax=Aphanomyces astaci TaxID=112090 RepID=W4FCK0_APHAT|nr:hypothetical protein H257_17997 [Aphanomyces astaci]ETV65222.1 hypothetical protein H257_17997 [Aphanomyces astaci]RQM29917.1 hypothetical protein B5M09_012337 [Aphanomyces astaci]|eukprot:XP_009845289.1 hypothetical protein H257_17997 [Aphanomyces astaci]
MHDTQDLHDWLLRSLLVVHHGYEITTAGGSFQLAFHGIGDALAYCLDVQTQLLLLPLAPLSTESSIKGQRQRLKKAPYLFHGIRVRMGIHASEAIEDQVSGQIYKKTHPVTHRISYVGLPELIGGEVSDLGHDGQIVITSPVAKWLELPRKPTQMMPAYLES